MVSTGKSVNTKFMFELDDARLSFAIRRHCFQRNINIRDFFRDAAILNLMEEGDIQDESSLEYIKLPGEK